MASPHRERRLRLLASLGDAVAILPTAPERVRNADCFFPFRADSHFLYLTGFSEPEALLVLDGRTGRSGLFCRKKHPEREIWDGFRHGPAGAAERFGFDDAWPIDELDERMPDLLAGREAVHWPVGKDPAFDARVAGWLQSVRLRERQGVSAPSVCVNVLDAIDEMRLVKDADEIALMRQAGSISAGAHVAAMRTARPGLFEYQVEAEIVAHFMRHGARQPAYESIVAGGANACTLHYVGNHDVLRDGDLLLIDAGCEYQGYAGDITRTFPVNGRFTGPQRDVYEIVLAAQMAAIDAISPGAPLTAPADAALTILAQGMLDLGLLGGSLDGVLESGAWKQFYMHGIGHMIGLDVHDVGRRHVAGGVRRFESGMCTTVEPGLYIRPAPGVPEAFHHIGIRIEDDVLVTETGAEAYTRDVPKTVEAIEALMSERD
ncbi:aminopeptidase P N-terminal domain-containing protein [Paludibacterium paludis]|uniref:Xaa-Pro aminopeptidase n=1 Tax=Paludibacterium paludis TaxID=1225769 RepID=A0A918U8V7_9NEIS|nr:aminopeptidase P N-terminal domain-containing protein [Paludibacterium paludis]GGY11098.1 Xaa-Pro aminopeptidase [Paludibacterium paludis]